MKWYKLVSMWVGTKITRPRSEMIEGPEAWTLFKETMNRVLTVPHSEIRKRIEQHRAEAAMNPNRPGPKPKRKVKRSASRVSAIYLIGLVASTNVPISSE